MLGVVLNRAERKMDDTKYYYQPRHQRASGPVAVAAEVYDDGTPEMIYIEEELAS
jgi:hypothetical protein